MIEFENTNLLSYFFSSHGEEGVARQSWYCGFFHSLKSSEIYHGNMESICLLSYLISESFTITQSRPLPTLARTKRKAT